MAVVQISRIQVRRGKKNEGSGLPQLASGEFGWAVDSQELYIGNGSVSEGSPQVGNTRILTANDNIFDFATQYTFRNNEPEDIVQTGLEASTPVVRSVQQRLDERVSLASFGVEGASEVAYDFALPTLDVTQKLQHAINQLYLSSVAKNSLTQRLQLFVPAGHYTLTETIYLPPFISLVGEDVNKTFFHTTASVGFRTVTSDSAYAGSDMQFVYDDPSISYNGDPNTQTKSFLLQNFTIDVFQPKAIGVILESSVEGEIKDVKVTGSYNNALTYLDGEGSAFLLKQLNNVVQTKDVYFSNVTVDGFNNGLYLDELVNRNVFDNLKIKNCAQGIVIKGNSNIIKNSFFENIENQGILVINGNDNISRNNEYLKVGNLGGEETAASLPVLEFSGIGNTSVNDVFNRTKTLGSNSSTYLSIPYKSEIKGPGIHNSDFNYRSQVEYAPVNEATLLRIPANVKATTKINYNYQSTDNNLVRHGTISISYLPVDNSIHIVDEYDGIASTVASLDALQFSAEYVQGTESIHLKYLNSISETSEVYFYYNISHVQ